MRGGIREMSISIDNIPQMAIDDLIVMIGDNTQSKLFKYVLTDVDKSRESLHSYIRNILQNHFYSSDELVDLFEIKNSYHRKRQSTKKNWLKKLKEDVKDNKPNPINSELDVLKKVMDRKTLENYVKDVFNLEDSKTYVEQQLKEIDKWAKSHETNITDYPFLETKQMYQIEKAFENDIIYAICKFLEDKPKRFWISERPEQLVNYPIFADGRSKFSPSGKEFNHEKEEKTTVSLYQDYKLSDDRFFRTFLNLKEDEQIQLEKSLSLDTTDNEILEHVLEQRDNLFYTDQTIIFDVRPLLLRIYNSTSKKSYDLLEERLKKIGRFSFEGRTIGPDNKVNVSFLYNLFQEVEFKRDEATGRVFAEIIFSNKLHRHIVTNQAIKIYSPFYRRLENKLSKILIYAFQKERIDAYVNNRDLKIVFEYSYFTDRIRFRSKRIESNIKEIESSLQDFKNAQILIEDYKRVGHHFEIVLTPLSESEIGDFQLQKKLNTIN